MISFKLFFESVQAPPIVPQDIYTFYYISLNIDKFNLKDEESKANLLHFFNTLKAKYLNTFSTVLKDQIIKYIGYQKAGRERIRVSSELRHMNPEEFAKNPVTDYDKLEKYTKDTIRSSGADNVLWDLLAEWLNKLSKTTISIGSIKGKGESALFILDRINNCVHNTGKSMFEKVKENGTILIDAYNKASSAKSDTALKPQVYKDIRDLPLNAEATTIVSNSDILSKMDKQSMSSFYKGKTGD
jgi:hypothetical protein